MVMRADLAPLYPLSHAISPSMARIYRAVWRKQGQIYARDLLPKPHYAGGRAEALKALTMCVWGFMPDGVLNQWLTEEESLWLQSRIYARAYYFTTVGRNICRLFVGRL